MDGVQVEVLLSDKKSWKYLPYIESKNGFVIEVNEAIVGFIGYQEIEPLNVIQILNSNNVSLYGWTKEDFENDSNEIIQITQFCVNYKYHSQGVGVNYLSILSIHFQINMMIKSILYHLD